MDERTLYGFLWTEIWCEVVFVFVERLKSLLSRLEMGKVPRPPAGAERSDGRPTVGRLEPSKGPFSPVFSENQTSLEISEIIRNLQRMNICCSCAQELEGTAEPGLMLYGPAVAFLETMSEMEVAWVRAKVELVGITWIPTYQEKVVLSWSWTKIWELLYL